MKFWFSGEIDVEIADSYRRIRNALEVRLNALCAAHNYGHVVQEIAIIPIILSAKSQTGRKERRLWKRQTGVADYRLIINFEQFKCGDDVVRQRLLLENTVQAIRDIERKVGKDFAGDVLIKDIIAEFGDFESA